MDWKYRKYFALICGTYDNEHREGQSILNMTYNDRLVDIYPDGKVCWHKHNEYFNDEQLDGFDSFLIMEVTKEMRTIRWALEQARQ